MKKRVLIVTAILAVILVCSLVLSACVSANYSKTKKSLEKKGYTVEGTEDASELDDDISWYLSGIKGTDDDTVVSVVCYKSSGKAKDAIKEYEKYGDHIKAYNKAGNDDYCYYRTGKVIVVGKKSAVKDVK